MRSVTTVRRAIEHLSGILQIAAEHGVIPANPARSVRKVPAERKPPVSPLAPAELEAVIAALTGRDRTIALLLGHCGLRPIEARLVPWRELRGDTLTIRADLTKATAAYARTITVPAETQRELRRWRLESGVPDDDRPIVGAITAGTMGQWGPATLKPTVRATVGRTEGVTPYLLRHTHASLLHYCGYTVPSAAARMGHAATEHLSTYAHVVKALEGRPHYADLDALIAAARADLAFPARSRTVTESGDLQG